MIPEALTEELRTRGVLRRQREEARLSEIADRRRNAAQLAYLEEEHRRRELLERYRYQTARYPLGEIGRLRDLAGDDHRPAVLVSPPVRASDTVRLRIPGLVHDALHDVNDFVRYAALHTGGFVSDGGVSRAIEGSVGAAEISALEFSGRPAILVYFEADGDRLNAFAYLGSVFPAADGPAGFPVRIASFSRGGGTTTRADGSLPVWPHVNLSELDHPDELVIAALVASFVVSCVEAFWSLQGVRDLRLGTIPALPSSAPRRGALIDRVTDTGSVFGHRVETEALALLNLGFQPIETVEYGPDQVALIASRDDLAVSFVLDPDFPASPPEVFYVDAGAREHVALDPSVWSPEHTLAEIVEALR
ncbi:hypothetical protein ACQPZP_34825 [Spirillospora sp. CA-142024]|uniref:hypothetical protein n=1 Tax=Spirillospora sp. CA-142024 TaxID=3240036 RepID=UPI003D9207CA